MAGSRDENAELEDRVGVLERDVAALHEQLAVVRSDAEAARTLASGADREVSEVRAELRAHTRALTALRETQVEQGHAIDELRTETRSGFATLNDVTNRIVRLLSDAHGEEPT